MLTACRKTSYSSWSVLQTSYLKVETIGVHLHQRSMENYKQIPNSITICINGSSLIVYIIISTIYLYYHHMIIQLIYKHIHKQVQGSQRGRLSSNATICSYLHKLVDTNSINTIDIYPHKLVHRRVHYYSTKNV